MTDVAAEFAVASAALLAENAALKAQLSSEGDTPRQVQYLAGLNFLPDMTNMELCAEPGTILRYSQQGGTFPTDMGEQIAAHIEGDLTNVYVHDLHTVFWAKANHLTTAHLGGRLHGCLVKDIGWQGIDGGHGHTLYGQGYADAIKTVSASILVKSFDYTLHYYGSAAAALEGLHCQKTVFLGGMALVGGEAPVKAVRFDECFFAGCTPRWGYYSSANVDLSVTNCVLGYFLLTHPFQRFTFRENTVIANTGAGVFGLPSPYNPAWRENWDVDYNTYYSSAPQPFWSAEHGGMTLAQWRTNTGFDTHSQVLPLPTTPTVRVYPVDTGRHICNVAIDNRMLHANVTVALPLTKGGTYQLRQVQDYANDVRPFVYNGTGLTIQLAGSYALPDGVSAPLPSLVGNLTPKFAVFEVWD